MGVGVGEHLVCGFRIAKTHFVDARPRITGHSMLDGIVDKDVAGAIHREILRNKHVVSVDLRAEEIFIVSESNAKQFPGSKNNRGRVRRRAD